ncbi:hypothetical protein ACHAQK_001683 [Fusarium lateritium]
MAADALDLIHPDLLAIITRFDLLPTDEADLTEANLAKACILAIELADPDEQAAIVSRIISEEELAFEVLRSPEVLTVSHRVVLDRAERKAALEGDKDEHVPVSSSGQDCLICTEPANVRVPCGCDYCLSCLRIAIRNGLRSQEEFPPRCCKPFDEAAVALARSPPLIHLFRQMQEEADTPIHDRLYCHDGHCAAFIPPGCNGACLFCDHKTCVECFEEAHPGRPCEEGDAEEDVWATMDENKTVNCPGCGRMIELMEACNHITCICREQFCYICGKLWLSCHCPPYGHLEQMVPMKDRPGVKPPQFRRRRPRRMEEPTSRKAPLRIPQLRPQEGIERPFPRAVAARSRVIRPLRLPQQDDIQSERDRERRQRRQQRVAAQGAHLPLPLRQQGGARMRRNAVDLLQDEVYLAQPQLREANRLHGAPHHRHHRHQQETQPIPAGFLAALPGMQLLPGTHMPRPPHPGYFLPSRLMQEPPELIPPPTLVPRPMTVHEELSLHLAGRMSNDAYDDGDEDLFNGNAFQFPREPRQRVREPRQRTRAAQGQGPNPQLQTMRQEQLDPVAAIEQLRQVNLATQQRIAEYEAVQRTQHLRDLWQFNAGDPLQPPERDPM